MSPEHVPKLFEILKNDVAGRWELFLGQLEVTSGKITEIRGNRAQGPDFCALCLSDGLDYWVKSNDYPTYEAIITVLRGEVVPNLPLATKVASEFCGIEGTYTCIYCPPPDLCIFSLHIPCRNRGR